MVKRFLSIALAAITIVGVAISTAISASAKYTWVDYYEKDLKNYSTYVYGDYSRTYAAPGYTGVMATNSLYVDSYKRAYYVEYQENSGRYSIYNGHQYYGYGDDEVVISNIKEDVSNIVAERYHSGYVHLTGAYESSVKDSMICEIYKDTEEGVNG